MDIDTTKPNSGRIYDYYLGGSHNFEADRLAAERLLSLVPSARGGARLNRWFMYDVVERLAQSGFDCFLDLASGLPTEGYIHDLVPTARVLYNDIDPLTVAYGREIIGDSPNVRYIQADMNHIDTILQVAEQHFDGQRRIALCLIGISYFLDHTSIQTTLDRLWNWCAPGSQMALSCMSGSQAHIEEFQASQFAAMYKQLGAPVYPRTLDEVHNMLAKWRINEPGLIPLSQWNGVDNWLAQTTPIEDLHLDLYGVLVTKE